jgi:hypothetical protein
LHLQLELFWSTATGFFVLHTCAHAHACLASSSACLLPPPTRRLLATVPEADLKQAQQVVDTIRSMDEEASAAELQERAASLDKLL